MATWGELEKAGTKWRDLEEMTWGELEEFCVINPKTKQIPDDMEVSFVPMQSVSDTGDVQTDEVRKASEVKKGFTFFEEGDVLFAKITPCMENGKGGIARGLKNGVGFGSTEFHVLHPDPEKVSSEWLYYLTSWDEFRKQCARNMTGSAGQKRVPKSYLEHYKVHLPPLEEQRRIAAVLDKVSGLIAKRREQLDKLDELVKARFVEMFGDEQKKMLISDVCKIITDGTHQPPPFVPEGIPFLFVSNIVTNAITYDTEKYITQDTYDELIKRTPIEIGDILLSTVGSYGHPAIVKDNRRFLFQRHIAYLKPKTEVVYSEYLYSALLSDDVQRQIEEKVKGVAQKTLNLSEIRTINIPIPSSDKQEAFCRILEKIGKSKLTIQQSLDKLEVLKKALMQQYFG